VFPSMDGVPKPARLSIGTSSSAGCKLAFTLQF
jgi:hypothetical protein